MARPEKQGLDYFPLDVNIDDKVKLIEAKFGLIGFAVLVKLWQIIYENSYFIKWTERELLLYKNRINVDINLINDVINESVKWGLFDETLYRKYLVLTSRGIQKRYLEAVKRRKNVVMESPYVLINPSDFDNVSVVNVDINPVNDDISTQRKEKEIESIEKEKKKVCKKESRAYGEFDNVKLTDEEYNKLVERFTGIDDVIDRLSGYLESSGKKYKSHYAVLITWAKKDGLERQAEEEPEPLRPFESEAQREAQMEAISKLLARGGGLKTL